MLLIVLVIFLLFGGKKFPELVKGLAKGIKEVKNTTDDIKKEINENIEDTLK